MLTTLKIEHIYTLYIQFASMMLDNANTRIDNTILIHHSHLKLVPTRCV